MSNVETRLREMMNKPLSQLPTFIDIGRLARRIDVFIDQNDAEIEEKEKQNRMNARVMSERLDKLALNDRANSHASFLTRAIKKIVMYLEPPEDQEKLLKALDDFEGAASEDNLDLQNNIRALFEHFDENCRTVRVFKMINQAALSVAVTTLKMSVSTQKSFLSPETRMTKDVRTSDGWRIAIKINEDSICISHIRKEQTLGQPFAPDYWDVQWRLDLHYTVDMSELKNADIVVLDMSFGPLIPKETKEELERLYKTFDVHQPIQPIATSTPTTATTTINSSSESSGGGFFCSIV